MWNNVVNAWWPLVFYPATDAPRFTKGMWAMIGMALATLLATALVYALERREIRRRGGAPPALEDSEIAADENKVANEKRSFEGEFQQ